MTAMIVTYGPSLLAPNVNASPGATERSAPGACVS